MQIIEELKLNPEDCCFVLARGMKGPDGLASSDLPFVFFPKESFTVTFSFWENWTKVKELDAWLNKQAKGKDFYFYQPQSSFNIFQVINSHPLCKGFYYVEEGRSSYLTTLQLQSSSKTYFLRDWFYALNFKNRSKSLKHFFESQHPKYKGAYAISQWTFPDLPNKKQLGLPFKEKVFEEAYQKILVLEPLLEYGMLKETAWSYGLEQFLKNHVQAETIHYKFHPSQKKEQSIAAFETVCKAFPEINFEQISAEVSLEEVAVSTQAEFYVITSSVGLYAMVCGRSVYSIARYMKESDPGFQKTIDELPRVYKEELKFL